MGKEESFQQTEWEKVLWWANRSMSWGSSIQRLHPAAETVDHWDLHQLRWVSHTLCESKQVRPKMLQTDWFNLQVILEKQKWQGLIGTGLDHACHHWELFGGWGAFLHLGYEDDHTTLYTCQKVQNRAQKVNFTVYKSALKIHHQIYPLPKVIQEKNSDFQCDVILDFLFKYYLPQLSFLWFLSKKGSIHFEKSLQKNM